MPANEDKLNALLGLGVKPLKQDKIKPYRKPLDATPQQRLLDERRA